MSRIVNPSDTLARALRAASRGLTVAEASGFEGVAGRIREAAIASERLALVLAQLGRQGYSRRGSSEPVQASDIATVVDGVRRAVGELAQTTPRMLSSHYEGYCTALKVLIDTGHQVAERGVAPEPVEEASEWEPFRKGPPPRR